MHYTAGDAGAATWLHNLVKRGPAAVAAAVDASLAVRGCVGVREKKQS